MEDLVELVGERGEVGGAGRCVGICGQPPGEVGFLFAEGLEAVTVALNALVAKGGRELTFLEGFEVALELAFEAGDLGAAAAELLLDLRALPGGSFAGACERLLDESAVPLDVGELAEHGFLKPVLG